MLSEFLCENKSVWEDLKIFTIIGICFCIIVSVIAMVWLTCFMVKLLIKTFKTQVNNSYDVFVENNNAKTKSKKERNAKKRQAKDEQKMELLNMKLESQNKVYEMKKQKLAENLKQQEDKAKERYFPETENLEKTDKLEKSAKIVKEKETEPEEMPEQSVETKKNKK